MQNIRLWIFAIIGFSFWFILGFPFAHHHESFEWATQIQHAGITDSMVLTTGHFISYRPLGQYIAVALYRIFDNSLAPIQLYNYILTILSWFFLILSFREKRFLSLISIAAGGTLFVAFMYLFHLHGIYYSHLLLFISLLIFIERGEDTNNKFVIIFILALFSSLFHAFALCIFIAFLFGKAIERRKQLDKFQIIGGITMVVAACILYTLLVPNDLKIFNLERLVGQYSAFFKLEVNSLVSLSLILLILLSAASIKLAKQQRLVILSVSLKMITRRYAFSGLLLISSHFMLFTGTRSAHLSIIVVMICITIVSLDWERIEKGLSIFDQKYILYLNIMPFLFGLILVLLKMDVQLPVISKIARPILEKKEISEQMTKIVDWYMISAFKGYEIVVDECFNYSQNSISKRKVFLAPVSNHALNEYLRTMNNFEVQKEKFSDRIYVCFGNSKVESDKHIYTVKGRYAGDAQVYLSDNE
jgi:hypothetical protein